MKKIFFSLFLTINIWQAQAQIGGKATYQFLSVPYTARTSALAGSNLAIWEHDLNNTYINPSLLDSSLDQHLSLNYQNYLSDINYGLVSFAKYFKKYGTFAASINYLHYGEFTEADATGMRLGTFSASDYSFNIYYARPINDKWQIGTSFKILYSSYYHYSSVGFALDGGITYHNEEKNLSFAFVFQNLGHQLKAYREDNYEPLPFNTQIAFAKRLKHAPFRFLATIHHLNNWSMAYESPINLSNQLLQENDTTIKISVFDKIGNEFIRHLNVGVEIIPTKNIFLRVSYNFQRYKEMLVNDRFGMVGFSFGLGVKISKFRISYAHSIYHVAGTSNTFSITSNLHEFY